jgi:GDPmannose 4,6-dehydratase
MFTHCGPRRGDVFAESTFAKQIALIEAKKIPPIIKVGNLDSLRTFADVRDAVRAYHMLVTVDPIPGAYYNIGGDTTRTIGQMLDTLIDLSPSLARHFSPGLDQDVTLVKVETDPARLRPIDADLQVPDTRKFREHTGWYPQFTFERTMADLLDYWREKVRDRDYLTR